MDKYEFQIKTEQLEKLLEQREYKTAAKIADSIDWRKVHDVELLMEVAVKMGDFDEAVELYKEFIKAAPHDLGRYVLKYEIYRGRGSSVEDQIAILEEYKSREYQEQWAYELALLYYKEGMLSKCVEECDDLILWFSEGEYVIKAMELKMRIQPLTASQEEKYRQIADHTKAEEIRVKPVNVDEFNTSNLQAALAESLQDFIQEEEAEPEAEMPAAGWQNPEPEEVWEVPEGQDPEPEEPPARPEEEAKHWEPVEVQEPQRPQASLVMDTLKLPKFLGQDESGQLTFDMEENVIERQITGQMTISDILNGWEEKKRETEAAIAEAAARDEERRKEREYLRATGQLPDLNTEVVTTVPEEILRLIEEIEGRLPVKVHVEPLAASREEKEPEGSPQEIQRTQSRVSGEQPTEKLPEILEILEAQAQVWEAELPEDMDDIQDILEAGGRKAGKALFKIAGAGQNGEKTGGEAGRKTEGSTCPGTGKPAGGKSAAEEAGHPIPVADDGRFGAGFRSGNFHHSAGTAFGRTEEAFCLFYFGPGYEPAACRASGRGSDAQGAQGGFPGRKYSDYRRGRHRKDYAGCRYCESPAEAAPGQRGQDGQGGGRQPEREGRVRHGAEAGRRRAAD